MKTMNVESFNLDHRAVQAPFVRVADTKTLPGGDVLTKFDIRLRQPNVEHLEMPVVHSLEHLMAEHMRNHSDVVVDISPMGCQTGFYAIVLNTGYDAFLPLLETTLRDVVAADEVPAANEVQCGWGASHDLEGARAAAQGFLDARDAWEQVMA
ncbi:S-ribosylhomocysteine lyase [Georgenia sp. MJ170]|uniref:S-ribosylhomocysteine lyase n=1 Tax=Georgenia sunbinii TaxID=3117728 RepID=UPI002F26B41B